MRTVALLLLITISTTAFSQSDLLVLKKRNRTIKTYFAGSYIIFRTEDHQWLEGRIKYVRLDTLVISQMKLVHYINSFGLLMQDTIRFGSLKYHINQVEALPAPQKSVGFIRNGGLFKIMGGTYIGLNIFNSISSRQDFFATQNLINVGIAACIFGVGELLQEASPSELILGKKYRLQCIYFSRMKQ